MRMYRYAGIGLLVCFLCACSSAPHRPATAPVYPAELPYWTNITWQAELLTALQSVAVLPVNVPASRVAGVQGTIKLAYDQGVIRNPVVVVSTGSPQLDELLLRQVVTAKVPKPFGLDLGEAHQFELPLRMLTPDDSFRYKVYAAIGRQRFYGREGILAGDTGISTVNFDYRDGRVANVVITESSGHSELDKYSLQAVSRADMPVAPPAYAGQTLHLQARFCYDLNFAKKCPTGNDVIDVEGTRIVRRTFITY